jgi:predicted LPLAT superfamily acyltransferase
MPSPKSAEERAQEAEEREEKKSADRWLVRWTAALFAATVGLILATGVLGYFGLQQSRDMKASISAAESRRSGYPQRQSSHWHGIAGHSR